MRLFFLLLLLVNIAFFTWHYQMGAFAEREPAERVISQSDPDIPSLVLVSERDRGTRAAAQRGESPARAQQAPERSSATGTQQIAAAEPAAVKQRCIVAGPYAAQSAANAARRTAAGYGVDARIDETAHEVTVNSWVILEGRYSLAEARELLDEMRSKGLDDLAITPLEDGGHLISLGIYSRQATLESRLREILDHGYTAEVQKRTRSEPAYSLRLALEAEDLTPMSELIDELVEQEPSIEWREVECR